MTKKVQVSRIFFEVLLVLFGAGVSFILGYQVRGKVSQPRSTQTVLESVKATATPVFTSARQLEVKMNEMTKLQVKRQFLEEDLPLLPDLQQKIREQQITDVRLYNSDSGEVVYLIETLAEVDLKSGNYEMKNYFLISTPTWSQLEENMSASCSLERVSKLFIGNDYLEKNSPDNVTHLVYQIECEKKSQIGMIDLKKAEKVKIYGINLPSWLSASILSNGSFEGELTDLVGYGENQIFEVMLNPGETGAYRTSNRVIINGITGKIVDWLDYDKFAAVSTPAFGSPGW